MTNSCQLLKFSFLIASGVLAPRSIANAEAAQDSVIRLSSDIRVRYESVVLGSNSSEDLATARVRTLAEWTGNNLVSVLAEVEGVVRVPAHAHGHSPSRSGSLVPDTDSLEINRFQVNLTPLPGITFQAGRQVIALDDERFIGSSNFRQNQQTYDAATIGFANRGFAADLGYIWGVNRSVNPAGQSGTQGSQSGFLTVSAPAPLGRLSIFHYAVDLEPLGTDDVAGAKSGTTGMSWKARLGGSELAATFNAAIAGQVDRALPGARPKSTYGLVSAGLESDEISVSLRHEVLGGGAAAFQTRLGSLHGFQGSADVFTVTPAEGLKDTSFEAVWRQGSAGALRGLTWSARAHDFQAEETNLPLGEEIDFSVSAILAGCRISIEHASYFGPADTGDLSRTWLTFQRSF